MRQLEKNLLCWSFLRAWGFCLGIALKVGIRLSIKNDRSLVLDLSNWGICGVHAHHSDLSNGDAVWFIRLKAWLYLCSTLMQDSEGYPIGVEGNLGFLQLKIGIQDVLECQICV